MENVKKFLAEHCAVVDLAGDDGHAKAIVGCEVLSDRLVVQIDSKGKNECPGFEQVGYDPGRYAREWSTEAADNFADYLPDEYGALYSVVDCVRETIVLLDGCKLTLRQHL